ncbi:MAG: hypothetical protein ABEH81_16170, partial [Halopenitus sp.]
DFTSSGCARCCVLGVNTYSRSSSSAPTTAHLGGDKIRDGDDFSPSGERAKPERGGLAVVYL